MLFIMSIIILDFFHEIVILNNVLEVHLNHAIYCL